jgi:hypothetical protein
MLDVGVWDIVARRDPPEECPEGRRNFVDVLRKPRRHLDPRLVVVREQDMRCVHEVVEHRSRPKGDARQRVGDVAVEVREEAEAVFPRHKLTTRPRRSREIRRIGLASAERGGMFDMLALRAVADDFLHNRDAARLSARDLELLEDLDRKASLDELVRRAEPPDPAAENDHLLRHRGLLMRSRLRASGWRRCRIRRAPSAWSLARRRRTGGG